MADEFDDLAWAVGQHGRAVREYVRLEQQIQAELSPPPRPRRRFFPLLMVTVVVLTLTIPALFVGRAKFVSACIGVQVSPTDDLQALIDANGTGTTFCLQGGTHRITASGGLTPKTGDVFIGVGTAATVSGSKLLTGWTASGSDWFATGFLPGSAPGGSGTCAAATPLCNQPHDIFRNGVWLSPVASQAALTAGKAFVDYTNNRVYVRDNPTAATMEQTWASRLFTGTGDNVQVKNLILQHAASQTNTGAVDPGSGGTGWLVDHNEIRWNHGYGTGPGNVAFGATLDMTITANNVHHNGQDGTGADGVGNHVEGNEVHHNTYAGYDPLWDGGNKFGHARDLVVTGNYYHDEIGPGIWCDINCEDTTISNNYVDDSDIGIMFEISCGASIHDNIVVDTTGTISPLSASILISSSEGAEVYNNQTYNGTRGIWAISQDRTGDPTDCTGGGEHVVKDLNVHDNDIDHTGPAEPFGAKSGLFNDDGRTDLYSTLNNTFQGNTYYDPTPGSDWNWSMNSPPFTDEISFATWQARGQDTAGSVVSSDPSPPAPPTLVVGPQP